MNSIINKEDKIWKMFLGYIALIGAESREEGLDLYGADQKTILAKDLTVAHILDNIFDGLMDIKEQQATFERTKYHIKPETFVQRSVEVLPEKGTPNA